MRGTERAVRHIARHRWAYLAAMFLLIAAATCGVLTGAEAEGAEGFAVSLDAWHLLRLIAGETVCVLSLWLMCMHPFGCALAAALLAYKGFAVGYCWGWWRAAFGWSGAASFFVAMLPQGLLSLGGYAYGCCVAGSAALRIDRLSRTELLRLLVSVWVIQLVSLLLRCIGCVWMR